VDSTVTEEEFGKVGFPLLFCREQSMQIVGLRAVVKLARMNPVAARAAGTPYVIASYLTSHFRESNGGSYYVATLCEEAVRCSEAPDQLLQRCKEYVVLSKQFLCKECAESATIYQEDAGGGDRAGIFRCLVCSSVGHVQV
jgi:hypothetical protein